MRERERCVCVLFEFRQFFLLWELVYVYIFAKNLIAVSILEYNINSNWKSAERAKAFWFSEGRTK